MERLDPDSEKLIFEATDDKTSPNRSNELAKIGPTLTRLVAANPNANPDLLAELASREDREIRRTVAANPNAPTEVLWKLGEEFPEEVLDNAVFSLLLLENPNLIEAIPQKTMLSFLQSSIVPTSLMERSLTKGDRQHLLALTINPITPASILDRLVESQRDEVVEAARFHINYTGGAPKSNQDWESALREALPHVCWTQREYFINVDRDRLKSLMYVGLVPQWFFEQLAKHKSEKMRSTIASCSNLPASLLEELARDEWDEVRAAVAWNLKIPASLLEQLGSDENTEVRRRVAFTSYTPTKTLEKLGHDKSSQVREGVAKNYKAPVELLERWAQDRQNIALCREVAANSNTPIYLLEELVKDRRCRDRVAFNSKTPVYLLEELAKDEDARVRQEVARNYRTPTEVLERLAEDSDPSVRRNIAYNFYTPAFLLERLATDENPSVRAVVATNDKTPVEVLEKLVRAGDNFVAQAVARNSKISIELLEELLWSLASEYLSNELVLSRYLTKKPEALERVLEYYARKRSSNYSHSDDFSFSRAIALWHPQMPAKVLAENCRSLAWLERCAIARNPNTPNDVLQILAKDGNRIVRAAARENLSDARVMV